MKILIIAYFFPPTNTIGALRPYGWAKYWAEAGHDVAVLTTSPIPHLLTNPTNNIEKFSTLSVPHNDLLTRVKYKLKQFLGKKKYPIPSLTDLWWLKAYNQVKHNNYDLIVSTYGPYINHLIAYLIKQTHKNSKWVLDYRDPWVNNNYLHVNKFTSYFYKTLEKQFTKRGTIITSVSNQITEELKNRNNLKNVYTLYNGYDKSEITNLPKYKYWNDNKIRLLYTGTIYKNMRDPTPLFLAMQRIYNSNKEIEKFLEVLFVGYETDFIRLLLKNFTDIEKVIKIIPPVSREKCLHMQRDAHSLIFLENEANVATVTGKLFEYLISGTMILGIGISDQTTPGEIIKNANAGINFGINHKAIQDYLETLIENKNKPIANINYEYLEQFDKKNLSMKLLQLVENIENH